MPDDAFKALGDATRRRILEMLAEKGELAAGEIAARFSISAPSVSHHLRILKNAGLVRARRQGQTIHYRLNATGVRDVAGWLAGILALT